MLDVIVPFFQVLIECCGRDSLRFGTFVGAMNVLFKGSLCTLRHVRGVEDRYAVRLNHTHSCAHILPHTHTHARTP